MLGHAPSCSGSARARQPVETREPLARRRLGSRERLALQGACNGRSCASSRSRPRRAPRGAPARADPLVPPHPRRLALRELRIARQVPFQAGVIAPAQCFLRIRHAQEDTFGLEGEALLCHPGGIAASLPPRSTRKRASPLAILHVAELPQRLRRVHALLEPLAAGRPGVHGAVEPLAREAIERLEHDLLPRTAGASEYLVVGVVGPNNAGKSALFNALAGRALSPSVPTGGATRRLIGALHPILLERLASEPTLARLVLERVDAGAGGVQEALERAADPSELLVVAVAEMPRDVLLVDTPDFDSILTSRAASTALLRVVDLALVVVTPHLPEQRKSSLSCATGQHRKAVAARVQRVPRRSDHARARPETRHGSRVRARGALPGSFRPRHPARRACSRSHGLEGDGGAADRLSRAGSFARSGGRSQARCPRGFSRGLRDLLARIVRALGDARGSSRDRGTRAPCSLTRRSRRARAMPMGPFLEAFRAVLDRRPSLFQRGLRGALKTRLALEG